MHGALTVLDHSLAAPIAAPIADAGARPRALTVGLDVSPLGEPRTGIGRYAYELLGALWSVAQDQDIVPVGNRALADRDIPPRPTGSSTVRGPRFPSRAAWTFGLLPFWLPGAGMDLFHGTSYYAPFVRDVPTVVTFHDMTVLARPDLHPAARVLRARAVLRRVAERAAAIITLSESTKLDVTRCLEVAPERIHVVPGAAASCFRPSADPTGGREVLARYRLGGGGFLLAVGTLEPRKNLIRVIEAVGRLRRSGHPVRLVVAGRRGWNYRPIMQRVNCLGLSDAISFIGFVPDDDLACLMRAAAGLVYPSLCEGFGLPVIEAMASGLPVVTSATGALREVAGGAALLVDPTEVDSIAAGMLAVLDEGGGRQLRDAGLRRARQFTWHRTARATLSVYQGVVGQGG